MAPCCEDPLFEKACLVVRMARTFGVPTLQRYLEVDYSRAARLTSKPLSANFWRSTGFPDGKLPAALKRKTRQEPGHVKSLSE